MGSVLRELEGREVGVRPRELATGLEALEHLDRHVVERIRRAFIEAARGKQTTEERLAAMGQAYTELLANRDEIRFQMQAHAAAGDPELAKPIRQEFMSLWKDVQRTSGASDEQMWEFMGRGMLLNVVASLDLTSKFVPSGHEVPSAVREGERIG